MKLMAVYACSAKFHTLLVFLLNVKMLNEMVVAYYKRQTGKHLKENYRRNQ